ncbi:AAA family ATPase [Aliarcobacter butzleri]|uniref:AAA family ATPase n=1 Tax=Aliarcobacter butzleri TaxID=28197 RepID=UPI0021B65CD1|nr:hypothetical protein [Aliarcobacter butzleri]MCT7587485.1 hypothetical protein [Aliarcobacter butzleri]
MELVYLWVEDYKNIHKQGFNFSPDFDVKFTPVYENEKLSEKSELNITPKENLLKDFFGENINITAIVGENGSGKSTIFELVSLLRLEFNQLLSKSKILILFENNNIFYPIIDVNYHDFICIPNTQITNYTGVSLYDKKSVFASKLFYITMFTGTFTDFTYQNRVISTMRESDKYDNFYNGLSLNYTNPNEENKILEQSLKYTNIMQQDSNIFDFLGANFLFDNFCFEIDLNSNLEYTFDKEYINKIEDYTMKFNSFDIYNMGEYYDKFDENRKIKKKYEDKIKETAFYRFASYYYIETVIKAYEHFKRDLGNELLDKKILEYIEELNHLIKIIETTKKEKKLKSEDTDLLKYFTAISLCNKYLDLLKKILNSFYVYIEKTQKNGLIYELEKELKYYKKKLNIFKHINLVYRIFKKDFYLKDYEYEKYTFISKNVSIQKNDMNKIKKQISLNGFLDEMYWTSVLKINFINGNISQYNYNRLSSGEKQLFNLMINFSYTFLRLDKESLEKMIIFLDEIDVGFHPNWQKKVIHNLLILTNKIKEIRNDTNMKFHFIFNSHSTFLLSDLPKENIIFLENGKQVYPFDEGKQTFGANIHTLLSHGFFMKNGLMGEFAKDKIQSIIKYHEYIEKKDILETDKSEYKTKKQKEFWQIQSIIGDDYLKQVIKNHLMEIEKIVLGNDEAKKEEVKRLKAQIELLEK